MIKNHWVQGSSVAIVLILVLNLILFALNKITQLMFWSIIILAAITAYKIVPKLNNK